VRSGGRMRRRDQAPPPHRRRRPFSCGAGSAQMRR
jgi:hypothetical protein